MSEYKVTGQVSYLTRESAMNMKVNSVFRKYLSYFVEDFAKRVLSKVAKSCPVDPDYLSQYINFKVASFFNDEGLEGKVAGSIVTKFVHECADHVIDGGMENPDSYEVWSEVSKLPSVYSDEIEALVYKTAQSYLSTMNDSIFGLIMHDTQSVVQTIRNKISSAYQQMETGGRIHKVTWGLLDNAVWLSSALTIANDRTGSFKPGEPYKAYYANACFDYAMSVSYEKVENGSLMDISSGFRILLNSTDESTINDYEGLSSQIDICDLLCYTSSTDAFLKDCKSNFNNPKRVIEDVSIISSIICILSEVKEFASKNDNASLVTEQTLDRINSLNLILTIALAGYEALRDTNYKDTLIFYASRNEDDLIYDVYVNSDNIKAFLEGGDTPREESDLLVLGTYAANNSNQMPGRGWSLSWANERFDEISQLIMSEAMEERERNDALYKNKVRDIVSEELTAVAESYVDMNKLQSVPTSISSEIKQIASSASSDPEFVFEDTVFNILLKSTGNSAIIDLGTRVFENLSSEDEIIRESHKALSIAETAVENMVSFLYA